MWQRVAVENEHICIGTMGKRKEIGSQVIIHYFIFICFVDDFCFVVKILFRFLFLLWVGCLEISQYFGF